MLTVCPCAATLNDNSPTRRRVLLASSTAYRMRTRRLLLRKLSSSTGGGEQISPRSAEGTLSTLSSLLSKPRELTFEAAGDAENLFDKSLSQISVDAVRGDAMGEVLMICEGLLEYSEMLDSLEKQNQMRVVAAHQLHKLALVRARTMLASEEPVCMKDKRIVLEMRRVGAGQESVHGECLNMLGPAASEIRLQLQNEDQSAGVPVGFSQPPLCLLRMKERTHAHTDTHICARASIDSRIM